MIDTAIITEARVPPILERISAEKAAIGISGSVSGLHRYTRPARIGRPIQRKSITFDL